MSLLVQNSTSAERAIGLKFAETFETQDAVKKNGGTFTGNPTVDFGMTTDGTEDVVTYPEAEQIKTISFFITLETTTENIMQLSSSHSIEAGSGTLTATGVTSPTFYVNGVATAAIGTARSHVMITTATAFDADAIQVGQDASFGQFKIEDLKMFNTELGIQDALNYANNSNFNYAEKATLHLPMRLADHDPTNVKTLDRSGNGKDATFGDGSTSTTYPTKLSAHGYELDGGDYFKGTATGVFNSDKIGIAIEFYPDFEVSANQQYIFMDTTGANRYVIAKENNASSNGLDIFLGSTQIENIVEANYTDAWRTGQKNLLVISGDATNNVTNVWLNGVQILTDDTTAWSSGNPDNYWVGSANTTGSKFDGKITEVIVLPLAPTALQAADLLIRSDKKVNNL